MDKVIVLAYDLGAVLIILMTMARSAQKGFATGVFQLVGRLPPSLARCLWQGKGQASFTTAF